MSSILHTGDRVRIKTDKVSVLKEPTVKRESCFITKGEKLDPLKTFKRPDGNSDEVQTVIRRMAKRSEFLMGPPFSKYNNKYHYNVEWNFRVIISFFFQGQVTFNHS